MSQVGTYLNFDGKTEEAFNFYKSVFGGEFQGPISRFGDMPPQPNMPELTAEQKKRVMHVSLPIMDNFRLMGSDTMTGFGSSLVVGNNFHISLAPLTKGETENLFKKLSAGGKVTMPLADTFWGAYFGMCTDKYGVSWMFNHEAKS